MEEGKASVAVTSGIKDEATRSPPSTPPRQRPSWLPRSSSGIMSKLVKGVIGSDGQDSHLPASMDENRRNMVQEAAWTRDLSSLYEVPRSITSVQADFDIIAVHGYGEDLTSAWTFLPDLDNKKRLEDQENIGSSAPSRKSTGEEPGKDGRSSANEPKTPSQHIGTIDDLERGKTSHPGSEPHKIGDHEKSVMDWVKEVPPGKPPAALSPSKKVKWLEDADLIPGTLKRARILLYEWKAPPDRSVPVSLEDGLLLSRERRLLEVARDLRDRLCDARSTCSNRPIILIGHDFGLTIIEKLLIDCWKDEAFKDKVCFVTAGLVFLATPSDSSDDRNQEPVSRSATEQKAKREPYRISFSNVMSKENDVHLAGGDVQPNEYETRHLESFNDFQNELHQARCSLTFESVKSDGRISSSTDASYIQILEIITKIMNVYPLLVAAATGKQESLEKLLASGSSPNLQSKSSECALHLAVRRQDRQMVRLLLDRYNADVEIQDCDGNTALHLAMKLYASTKNDDLVNKLLEKGADVTTSNKAGQSPRDLGVALGVKEILMRRPLVKGVTEDAVLQGRIPSPPQGSSALSACKSFYAWLAEFYIIGKDEWFLYEKPSVHEVLYEHGPDEILNCVRDPQKTQGNKPRCKWYHLPANNVRWVDDLFAKLNLSKDPLVSDQHEGPTPWSHYMRPQARSFQPKRLMTRLMDGKEVWQSTDCNGKNFVIFMPFLTYERTCDQSALNGVIEETFENCPNAPFQCPGSASETTLHAQVPYQEQATSRVRPDEYDPLMEEKSLVKGYLWEEDMVQDMAGGGTPDATPLHVKRTLDQSHYFMLKDSTIRDKTQVVQRGAINRVLDDRQNNAYGSSSRARLLRGDSTDQTSRLVLGRGQERGSSERISHNASGAVADTEPVKPSKTGIGNTIQNSQEDSMISDPKEPGDTPEAQYPMVMVDQLWLWVIDDTVITSFPQKWMQPDLRRDGGDVLECIHRSLLAKRDRAPISSPQELVSVIISHCAGVFNRPRFSLSLRLHDYFEAAVGTVADEEMKLFKDFQQALDPFESSTEEDLTELLANKNRLEELNNFFKIGLAVKLLYENKDIRDELRMILRILHDQSLVVSDMASILRAQASSGQSPAQSPNSPQGSLATGQLNATQPHQVITTFTEGTAEAPTRSDVVSMPSKSRHPIIDANIRDFDRMLSHANACYEALNDLLDLKQKHANAMEARFARMGAAETARQGNTIMFFTVVTIIFGSLSFVAAFFALDINAFPKGDGGTTTWKLSHIVGYIAGVSFGLSIPFVILAFYINPMIELYSNEESPLRFGRTWRYAKSWFGSKKAGQADNRGDESRTSMQKAASALGFPNILESAKTVRYGKTIRKLGLLLGKGRGDSITAQVNINGHAKIPHPRTKRSSEWPSDEGTRNSDVPGFSRPHSRLGDFTE